MIRLVTQKVTALASEDASQHDAVQGIPVNHMGEDPSILFR